MAGSVVKRTGNKINRMTVTGNEWFKNVVKSVGFASTDLIREISPTTIDFVGTNINSVREIYDNKKNNDQSSRNRDKKLISNDYYKLGQNYIKNAMSDIKSGKLYNKERLESTYDDGFELDDFDFSFGDDDFDNSDDNNEESPTSNKTIINNINANITKNNPMVKSINAQTEAMVNIANANTNISTSLTSSSISVVSKFATDTITGISAMNDNLSALVNFNNDSMSKYIAASIKYYDESLSVLNNSLDQMKYTNGNVDKKEEQEQVTPFSYSGSFDIGNYGKVLKKNLKGVIEDDFVLNSLNMMFTDKSTLQMMVNNPLASVPMMASKVLIPSLVRSSAKSFDESLSSFFPALLSKFNKMSTKDNWLLSNIGKIFGFKPKNQSFNVDVANYNKEAMSFNGITQKAITEVIPTYLRKILSAISGQNEMVFDYQKGKYVDYMQAINENNKNIKNRALNSMSTYSELKRRLGAFESGSKAEQEELYSELDEFMYKLSQSQGGIGLRRRNKRNGEEVDDFGDFYEKNIPEGKYEKVIRSAILSLNKGQQMSLIGKDIFDAKESVGRYFDDMMKNVGESIVPVLEAWDSKGDYSEKDSGSGKFVRKSFNVDKFGFSSMDYIRDIRNMIAEGIVVFPDAGTLVSSSSTTPNNSSPGGRHLEYRNKIISKMAKAKEQEKNEKERKRRNDELNRSGSESERMLRRQGVKHIDTFSELYGMEETEMTDHFVQFAELDELDSKNEEMRTGNGFVDNIVRKIEGKKQGTRSFIDSVMMAPAKIFSSTLKVLDDSLYGIVFGVSPDGKRTSFISEILSDFKTTFTEFTTYMQEKFFEPMKESLIGENGLITKAKNSDQWKKAKEWWGKGLNSVFGNADEQGFRSDGVLSDVWNMFHKTKQNVKGTFKGTMNAGGTEFSNMMKYAMNNSKAYLLGNKKSHSKPKKVTKASYTSSDEAKGGSVPEMLNGFVYYSQNDPKYKNVQYGITGMGNGNSNTFGDAGCAPTAMSMVVSGLTCKGVDPTTVGQEATNNGFVTPKGTSGKFFNYMSSKFGLTSREKSTNESNIKASINSKKPFILRGKGKAPFTNDGHFVVGVGGKNGKVLINDPNGKSTSGEYNINQIANDSNKMWSFDDTGNGSIKYKSNDMKGRRNVKGKRFTSDFTRRVSSDGSGYIDGALIELAEGVKEAGSNIIDIAFGEQGNDDRETKVQKFKNYFDKAIPKGIASGMVGATVGTLTALTGGMGLMGSFFLPGGPIGGAILGMATGLLSQSDKFKTWLFGKDEIDENGNSTGKKVGGMINNKIQETFKKNKVGIVGGATIGALKGTLFNSGATGILGSMFLGGPMTGALIGAATGLVVKSDKFQQMVFGKTDEETQKKMGGVLSGAYNKVVDSKKLIGGGLLGAASGAIGSAALANMGLMGSMFFSGPIGLSIAGAGLGIATSSKKWSEAVFGKVDEYSGLRKGGLMGAAKGWMDLNVFQPLKITMEDTISDMKAFVGKRIMTPLNLFIDPVKKKLTMIGESVTNAVTDVKDSVILRLDKWIGEPLRKVFGGMFSVFKTVTGKAFDATKLVGKAVVGAPFKVLESIGGFTAGRIEKGAKRKQDKYNKSLLELQNFDDMYGADSDNLSEYLRKKRDNLRSKVNRYEMTEEDLSALNYKSDWKERRKTLRNEFDLERQTRKDEINKDREKLRNQKKFAKVFGYGADYDEDIMAKYDEFFLDKNGNKLKGKQLKEARKRAEAFKDNIKDGKDVGASLAVSKEMRVDVGGIKNTLNRILDVISYNLNVPDISTRGSRRRRVSRISQTTKDSLAGKDIISLDGTSEVSEGLFNESFDSDKEQESSSTVAEIDKKQEEVMSAGDADKKQAKMEKINEKQKKVSFIEKVTGSFANIIDGNKKHRKEWSSIFGKKGIFMLAAIPLFFAATKFFKNFKDIIGGVLSIFNKKVDENRDSDGDGIADVKDDILHADIGKLVRNVTFGYGGSLTKQSIGHTISKKFAKTGVKKVAEATTEKLTREAGSEVAEKAVKTVAKKSVKEVAKTTIEKASQMTFKKFKDIVISIVKGFFGNKQLQQNMSEKACKEATEEMVQAISKACTEKMMKKFSPKISKAIGTVAGKAAAGVASGGLITAAFAAYDTIDGMRNAARIFGVPSNQVDWKMRLIAGLIRAILGIGMVGPIIDVANEILIEFTAGKADLVEKMASIAYKFMSNDEGDLKLDQLQKQLENEVSAYNTSNGTTMTKQAYQDMQKKNNSLWTKTKNMFSKVVGPREEKDFSSFNYSNGSFRRTSSIVSPSYSTSYGNGIGDGYFEQALMNNYTNSKNKPSINFKDNTTVGSSGCGQTAMAMVTSQLTGKKVDPLEMATLSAATSYSTKKGLGSGFFGFASSRYGLNMKEQKLNEDNLISSLNSGQPVIINGTAPIWSSPASSPYTPAGHYIVATKLSNGKVAVNDPRGAKYSKQYPIKNLMRGGQMMWSFSKKPTKSTTAILNGQNIALNLASNAANSSSVSQSNYSSTNNYNNNSSDAVGPQKFSLEIMVEYALSQVGKPYVWGAVGPNSFDCSGLVDRAMEAAGAPYKRYVAQDLFNVCCTEIKKRDLQFGDLGFYKDNSGKITHVTIYIGNGQYVHAEGGKGYQGAGGAVRINEAKYLNKFGRLKEFSADGSYGSVLSANKPGEFEGISSILGFMGKTVGTFLNRTLFNDDKDQHQTFEQYVLSNGVTPMDIGSVALSSMESYASSGKINGSTQIGKYHTTVDKLNSILSGRLSGKGQFIYDTAKKYGVDPALAASIMMQETGGTSQALYNKNNPGGIMTSSGLRQFGSLNEGIEYTIKNLGGKNYAGKTTIGEIGATYAPVGAANDPRNLNSEWVGGVSKFYNNAVYGSGNGITSQVSSTMPKYTPTPVFSSSDIYTKVKPQSYKTTYFNAKTEEAENKSESKESYTALLEKVVTVLETISDSNISIGKGIKDIVVSSNTNGNINNTNLINNVNAKKSPNNKQNPTSTKPSASQQRNASIAKRIAEGSLF